MKSISPFLVVAVGCISSISGCVRGFPALPANADVENIWRGEVIAELGRARLYKDWAVQGGSGFELDLLAAPGVLEGFLSSPLENRKRALVVAVNGASFIQSEGRYGSARDWHHNEAGPFWNAGYETLVLAESECGTAYGQEDLDQLIELLDWLELEGKAILDVDSVYIMGHSKGAILVGLVERFRHVNAVAAVSGVYTPEYLWEIENISQLMEFLSPNNTMACQLQQTFVTYGAHDSAAWDFLDTTAHVGEFQSPGIFLHGTNDLVFNVESVHELERAYHAAVASGMTPAPAEFHFMAGAGHIGMRKDPEVVNIILEFFSRFPSPAPGT